MTRDEAYEKLLSVFAQNMGIETPESFTTTDKKKILEAMMQKDQELTKKLQELGNIKDAYEFIRHDKDLRLKAQDIWKIENKRIGEVLNQCLDQLNITSADQDKLEKYLSRLKVEIQ
jgi:regulator of replication initiation timing